MRLWIVGFAAGAAWLQTQSVLPDAARLLQMAAIAAMAIVLGLAARRFHVALVLRAGSGMLLGFAWAALLAHRVLAPSLASEDEGRDVTIVGVVHNLPYRFAEGVRFNFAVESVEHTAMRVPPLISLSWYGGFGAAQANVPQVQPGERWRVAVRLQRPHGNANPRGFDFEAWLLEQGIRATGYVRQSRDNRRIDDFVPGIRSAIERSRAALRERILAALGGRPYAAVVVALVVGDQRGIDQENWAVFTRTGIGHLISISGLHITMIAGLAALAASSLWRRSFFTRAQLPLLLPAQKVGALCALLVALWYVALAGFGIPAQRTLYMLAVVTVAIWTGRIASVSHVLCLALGAVVLFDPWAVMAPGFWLSFGAVAMILFASTGRTADGARGWRAALRTAAHTQYVVTVGLVPVTMLLFSQVSLASPFANAIAIPLVSLVVTPLSLAGALMPDPLSAWLLLCAHGVIAALGWVLGYLSAMPLAVWHAPAPAPWVFCFALLGTLWMLAPRGWPLRWAGVVAWLPLVAGQAPVPEHGEFSVTAFDVGQGSALLIETHQHRLLYDAGPQYSRESNAGTRVIVPFFRSHGIAALDAMIVSHSDVDHAGGALAVLGAVPVAWVSSSLRPSHPIVGAAASHTRCAAGQAWTWDGVRFEVLHPGLASYDDESLKPNARSCTLRISAGGRSILLAADIEAAQEGELLVRSRHKLPADVLLVPHHGSGTSSTPGFLHSVAPRLALFQVGYRNRYRHPKAQVYQRYGELGIERLRTDVDGAIILQSAQGLRPVSHRRQYRRYWHGR